MLWKASGKIQRLEEGGCPVGLLSVATYEQGEIVLEKGDIVLCFSDGVTEATDREGQMWDEPAVGQVLERREGLGEAEIIGALIDGAAALPDGSVQSDDVSVVWV